MKIEPKNTGTSVIGIARWKEIEEALAWIEEHKKKSTKHDNILKLLAFGVTLCLFPAFVALFMYFPKTIFKDFLYPEMFIPYILTIIFSYTLFRQINNANK